MVAVEIRLLLQNYSSSGHRCTQLRRRKRNKRFCLAVGYSQSSVSQPVPCVCFSARADDSSERASDSSERAGDSSESAGDNGKDYRGFLREHVRLYPKFVRQWGVSGCQRSQRWVLLVMNSKGGMVNSVWPPGSHQNSSSETECGGAATDEMPPQRWVYGWI